MRLYPGLLLASGLVLLSGCTISTIYLTPAIKGTVVDVASLTPAANVMVTQQYKGNNVASTHTNNTGKFKVTAHSEVQVKMLLVGHALKNYTLKVSSQGMSNLHIYKASMVMRAEEKIVDEIVFFDSEPSVIAPPPIHHKTTQQWQNELKSEHFFSCNSLIGDAAIQQLAIARKVVNHEYNTIEENEPNRKKEYIGLAYYQLRLTWDNYYNSCKHNESLKPVLVKRIKEMYSEISRYEKVY
jgi:hypothetical protein